MAEVLIIDDEEPLARALAAGLEAAGHSVRVASDGRAGVAAFRKQRAEIVITDILMPERDGLELIGELRRLDPSVRIIAVSGGGSTGMDFLPVAVQLGATTALSKPFTVAAVLAAIAQLQRS